MTTPAALEQQLGGHDQKKLDEYLTSVREIERRLEQAEQFKNFPSPAVETPPGIPGTFREHIELMFDMMILAFQTDSTRIATFLLANEGSNRTFPDINISEGHHNLSHHRNKKEPLDKIADIDRWYVQQFARFLEKMEAVKDVDGKSLLHNSMIVYGSGNADGNAHTHSNLPVILAGTGRGCLVGGTPCQVQVAADEQPLSQHARSNGSCEVPRLGDSTGRGSGDLKSNIGMSPQVDLRIEGIGGRSTDSGDCCWVRRAEPYPHSYVKKIPELLPASASAGGPLRSGQSGTGERRHVPYPRSGSTTSRVPATCQHLVLRPFRRCFEISFLLNTPLPTSLGRLP